VGGPEGRRGRDQPAGFIALDLLWSDGRDRCHEPWKDRRTRPESFDLAGEAWSVPAHLGDGAALRDVAAEHGLDALIARRTSSPYRPGQRTKDWFRVPVRG